MRKPDEHSTAGQHPQMQILRAIDVRRCLTVPGDIRTEIAFQNDINALLARFDEVKVPWVPLAGAYPTLPVSVVADTTPVPALKPPRRSRRIEMPIPRLRVLDGGPLLELVGLVTPSPVRVSNPSPPSGRPPVTVTPAPTPTPGRTGGTRQPRRRA